MYNPEKNIFINYGRLLSTSLRTVITRVLFSNAPIICSTINIIKVKHGKKESHVYFTFNNVKMHIFLPQMQPDMLSKSLIYFF